jgi:stage III sporulation protein AA
VSLHYKLSVAQSQQTDSMSVNKGPDLWSDASQWFGGRIRSLISNIKHIDFGDVEELRLRVGQPFMVRTSQRDYFINMEGKVTSPDQAYIVNQEDLACALERMTHSSIYAIEEKLKQGFLILPGGNRVGVTGEAVLQGGKIQTLKHLSSLNLRFARDILGRGLKVLPHLLSLQKTFCNTLLISPPRAGKTTLLRDLIRLISNGVPQLGFAGQTVGVIDERGELAGMWQGVPTYDLGRRTDVLDGCPKAWGMGMLVRSMAPQVIAMDELGHREDVAALQDALRTGVRVLSSAHAGSLDEACHRPVLARLLEDETFERLIVLSRRQGPGTIEGVYDLGTGRVL